MPPSEQLSSEPGLALRSVQLVLLAGFGADGVAGSLKLSCTPNVCGELYRLELGGAERLPAKALEFAGPTAQAAETMGSSVIGERAATMSPEDHGHEKETAKAAPNGPTTASDVKFATLDAASVVAVRVPCR